MSGTTTSLDWAPMRAGRELTLGRVRSFLQRWILPAVESGRAPLEVAAHHVLGEPVPYSAAAAARFEPFPVGGAWGPAWSTSWFRFRGRVPEAWAGRRAEAVFDLGWTASVGFSAEGLVWAGGQPVQGLNPRHQAYPVATAARGGEEVRVLVEAAANPSLTSLEALRAFAAVPAGRPLFVLGRAELISIHSEVLALAHDIRVLLQIAAALPDGEPRPAEILVALDRACSTFDPQRPAATAAPARDGLAAVLARRATESAHLVTAAGHAHIDTAWLWPLREARRKCARTFSTALRLMEEYPEYRFSCSQPAHYQWIKEDHPGLYQQIKARVAEGRWEPVGAMWVEADCNITSGESLVRQILHGKRFYDREFGVETREVWLPDVFGYSAALPQIMAEAGIRWFMTQKISWSQFNPFPHHTFWWEGVDGTRVFTHFPPADTYNGSFDAAELVGSVSNFRQHAGSRRSLYLYGWGDGGGGPEPAMLESARRLRDLEGAPRVELGTARGFFESAEEEASDLPVWRGELYLELHRGTYTTQARTKQLNRRAELSLRDAELLAVAADPASYPAAELERAWKELLLHQFHDILPGSSIARVHAEAEAALGDVVAAADHIADRALAVIGDQVDSSEGDSILLFNTNSHPRAEVVEVEVEGMAGPLRAAGPAGEVVPVQIDGAVVRFPARVPPCGYAAYRLLQGEADPGAGVRVADGLLENERLAVRWGADGVLTSVFDKRAGREALAGPGNLFQLHPDYPAHWPAWDVDLQYRDTVEDLTGLESAATVLRGPLTAAVRFDRRFGRSSIEQVMSLDAGSDRLVFDTTVDWHEDDRFLKVAFPVAVRSARATYEIQFGHVERPTHQNTSWDLARFEVCAQRWVDLGQPDYGVALINDSKYGHDVLGGVIRLSLLRAPGYPDPGADRGRHRFRYALMPHSGDFRTAGVVQAGYDFNVPLRQARLSRRSGPEPRRRSLLAVDSPAVVIEAVKRAEDSDALIVRLYEAFGTTARTSLRLPAGITRVAVCDLLERERGELAVAGGTVSLELDPFRILTLKLT